MTDANSRQAAIQNLRDFQEMSYADVYALIRQKRFDEAKAKYIAVLESMEIDLFSGALNINITTPHDNLLECMSEIASKVENPEKIRAVGFDLSAHAIYNDQNGRLNQGIEVSLYSDDAYHFATASDAELTMQCEAPASEWQGAFMDIASCGLDGLGSIVQQFADHNQKQNNLQGIIEQENGIAIVDPVAIGRHVAKLLVAIEYHRYMADFVAEVEVPSEMIFIIGEHDEIEVPVVFYRVGQEAVEVSQAAPVIAEKTVPADTSIISPEPITQEVAVEHMEVEAPAMYHSMDDEQVMEEPQPQSDIDVTQGVEPAIETETAPETIAENEADVPSKNDEPERVSAKSMLGKPLTPRAFGQRSNQIFEDADKPEETPQSIAKN